MPLPVLVVGFSRPAHMKRVLESLKDWDTSALYIAIDGPRPSRLGESQLVDEVAKVAEITLPNAEKKVLRQPENLGCTRAVPAAIDWFFRHEERGIILEDDCVPDPHFLNFSECLLNHWEMDERVMMVSAQNPLPRIPDDHSEYLVLRNTMIWGWATWKRAWDHYDPLMTDWPRLRDTPWLMNIHNGDRVAVRYWTRTFDQVHAGGIDSWAYRWKYSVWLHAGVSLAPPCNLITNIGFGSRATNTTEAAMPNWVLNLPNCAPSFPLRHPPNLQTDTKNDRWIVRHVYPSKMMSSRTLKGAIRRLLRKMSVDFHLGRA